MSITKKEYLEMKGSLAFGKRKGNILEEEKKGFHQEDMDPQGPASSITPGFMGTPMGNPDYHTTDEFKQGLIQLNKIFTNVEYDVIESGKWDPSIINSAPGYE